MEGLLSDLFAYRFYLQDNIEDETVIIRELKMYLLNNHYNINDINQIIFNFYEKYNDNINTNITLETIENITIFPVLSHNNILNIINSFIFSVNINETEYIDDNEDFEDVRVTMNENDINKLKTKKMDSNIKEDCSICLCEMGENNIIELDCSHYFHDNCIKTYLKEYNYKCPICRIEVGQPKYNI